MTTTSYAGHNKLTDADAMTLETVERRKRIEREDRAFVAQLRTAIMCGLETPAACLGMNTARAGPHRVSQFLLGPVFLVRLVAAAIP